MNLQHIRAFIAVADAGNFTHAAESTYISQPTLSRQIKMLEDELGFDLLQRDKRPIRLTEAGKLFYAGMNKALAQMDYAREMAYAASLGQSGVLSLAFLSGTYVEQLCLPTLVELKETWPALKVRTTKCDYPGLVRGLQDGSFDLGVSFDFSLFRNAGLETVVIKTIETLIAAPANHPIAQKTKIANSDDLDDAVFFLNTPKDSYEIDTRWRESFAFRNTEFIEVPSLETAYLKVLTEGGLAITNEYDLIVKDNPLYCCIPVHAPSVANSVCVVRNPKNENAVAALFLELLRHANP